MAPNRDIIVQHGAARGAPANVRIEALPGQRGWLKHKVSSESIGRLIPFPRMKR
jgi:hypothetical protein